MKKRKLLGIMFSAVLAVNTFSMYGLFSTYADSSVVGTYGSITYVSNGNEVTITKCDPDATYEVIPSELDGQPVTKIDTKAFKDCAKLKGVVIPDSVKNIGLNSFENCTALNDVTLPDSVTSISGYMFAGCTSLTELELPKTTISIGYDAFKDCTKLKDIVLPEKIQTIGASAFENCKNLKKMDIPNTVLSIGDSAFENCVSMESSKIGSSVKILGSYAYSNCQSLKSIVIPKSVTSVGDGIFRNSFSMTSLKIESGNKSYCDVENVMFDIDKKELISYPAGRAAYSYTVPKTVEIIHSYAFYGNMHLTEITLPAALNEIGEWAFNSDDGYMNLNMVYYYNSADNSYSNPYDTLFPSFKQHESYYSKSSYLSVYNGEISNTTSSIKPKGDYIFVEPIDDFFTYDKNGNICHAAQKYYYHDLTENKVTIYYPCPKRGNTIQSVAEGALVWGDDYEELYCYDRLGNIVPFTGVKDNPSDNRLYVGDDRTVHWFRRTLNNSYVASVDDIEFTDIYLYNKTDDVILKDNFRLYMFLSLNENKKVPLDDIGVKYETDFREYEYVNGHEVIEKAIKVGDNNALDSSRFTKISDDCYYSCEPTLFVYYNKMLDTTANETDALKYENYKYHKYTANNVGICGYDTKAESAVIPGKIDRLSVTAIEDKAFYKCNDLQSVIISDSVETIGNYAFYFNSELESVTIPYSVSSIGNHAFAGCTDIKDVYFNGSESEWNKITFGVNNECLHNANIHFNSKGPETDPGTHDEYKLNISSLEVDEGDSFTLSVVDYDGKVKWSSNDTNIVTVSESGKIKAVKTGNAVISAVLDNGTTLKCTVTVNNSISAVVGDLNGDSDVDIADIVLLNKYILKISKTISVQSDVNKDGKVNVFDMIILRRIVLNS